MGLARAEPERSCVGCRTRRPKAELVRVVRERLGTVRLDPGGRAPGRGAYVCRDPSCARAATRRGTVDRALRVTLPREDLATLRTEIDTEIRRGGKL